MMKRKSLSLAVLVGVMLASAALVTILTRASAQSIPRPPSLRPQPQPQPVRPTPPRPAPTTQPVPKPQPTPTGRVASGGVVYPPMGDTFRRFHFPAPTWQAWWEANRGVYLHAHHQDVEQGADLESASQRRREAAQTLLEALGDDSFAIRGSAALALGQMGATTAQPWLIAVATKDKELRVRQAAILALGLLDTPEAEQALVDMLDKQSTERQTALMSLGLMRRLKPATIVAMRKFTQPPAMTSLSAWSLTRPLPPTDPVVLKTAVWATMQSGDIRERLIEGLRLEASAVSLWALSHQLDAPATLFRDAMGKTNTPWIASEAIQGLGRRGGQEDVSGLTHILLATPTGKALPAYRMLNEQNERFAELWRVRRSEAVCKDFRTMSQSVARAYQRTIQETYWTSTGRGAQRYMQQHFGGDTCDPAKITIGGQDGVAYDFGWLGVKASAKNVRVAEVIGYVNLGVEPVVMANLRASAALALGRIDTPASRKALRQAMTEPLAKINDKRFDTLDYSVIYKSAAIMALGQLGDVEAMPVLVELVRATPPAPARGVVTKPKDPDPLRGFAALALGLYSRVVTEDEQAKDRKDYDKVCLLLAQRMADRNEPEDFRAACALALGLSGREENLVFFQPADKVFGGSGDLLTGYAMLARGMLGDAEILGPARTFLSPKNNRTDRDGVLGRRAAVLGVGLTGSREAIGVLKETWELGSHIASETALAMALCQEHDRAGEKLLSVMGDTNVKLEGRALAARCLGELFATERPSRLTERLIAGSNHEMRIPRLTWPRAIADEFLYTFLLVPLDNEWDSFNPSSSE